MKNSLIALAAISTAFGAAPAFAGGVTIEHQDLNLNTAKGQQVLEQRIDKAARKICQLDSRRTGTRIRSRAGQTCYVQAKKQATQQMAAVVENRRLGG